MSVAALVAAAGCAKSTTTPTVPATAAPVQVAPANGSQIPNQSQPVTLVVQNVNGVAAGSRTYTFEVASDVAFTTKVQTKENITEGANGQTSVALDALLASKDYYWRAKAQAVGGTGTYTDLFKFSIGAPISLGAPSPISPLTNNETNPRPILRVLNASRAGAAGAITYRFEVARDAAFSSMLVVGTNTEGINETGYIITTDLPTRTPLYWRAFALDTANGITSAPSATQNFQAVPPSQAEAVAIQLGVTLWPGKVPPGSFGHATMGDNWQIQTLHYLPGNVFFKSPDLEMLRVFDLLDRGFDPDGAAAWMNSNGYPTAALWYPPPEKAVIGLQYVYLASRNKVFVNGTWEVVLRVE